MPWKTMEVRDQRVRFVVEAATVEKPLSQLCAEFGISRPTGYLWIDRYREGGVAAIAERSRRPRCSPEKIPEALEEQVVVLRQCYPDWGRASWPCCCATPCSCRPFQARVGWH
jgi:transposase